MSVRWLRLAMGTALAVSLAVSACSRRGPGSVPGGGSGTPPVTGTSTSGTPEPSPSPAPSLSPSPRPRFEGTISAIDAATAARMSASWRAGCPVPLDDLRLLHVTHWGFDGIARTGEIVVHAEVARDIVRVFHQLFHDRFPIRRMVLVDRYGADDDRAMAADDTSGFNCREATGHPGVWSEHSYGRAIDVNPRENPYVDGDTVLPPAGARYLDRSKQAVGMIHAGDAVVAAFSGIGWTWGGGYQSLKDYQHFSSTGR